MGSRRVQAAVGAMVAAVVLTACGTSDAEETGAAGASTATAAVTTAPTTTAAAPITTTPVTTTGPATTSAAPTTTYRRNEAVYFTDPSGGFQCGIIELATRTEAGCQGVTAPIPPRPESCMINWGSGIRVTGTTPGEFLCAGGIVYTSGGTDPVLPVGQTVASFGYTCESESDGVSCRSDETGHGFRIASGSNETF